MAPLHPLLETFVFLWFLSCSLSNGASISTTTCESAPYKGVAVGGKCYFIFKPTNTNWTSWTNAWGKCQSMNATLAQIHTSIEYSKVVPMMKTVLPGKSIWGWLALRRDSSDSNIGKYSITNTTTYWYDAGSVKNPNLPAGKTWIMTQSTGDRTDPGSEFFMGLFVGTSTSFFGDIPDNGAVSPTFPLCQIALCDQPYQYTTSNKCITETPIESVSGSDLQSCANRCASRIWCRSFNLLLDVANCANHTCQLFAWSSVETNPTSPRTKPSDTACMHYDNEA